MEKQKDSMLHVCRHYKPEVAAIHCLALQGSGNQLALSRSDNSIEVWDVGHCPILQKQIINKENISIENLKWFEKRLFSCGIHGFIDEYDLLACTRKITTSVTGGAAWCLSIATKQKLMAVGTEEGYINIFDILDEGIQFNKLLDKQEGRILCIAWNYNEEYLATGSLDTVRVWRADTGCAVHRMTTGRLTNNKQTIVWCIAVTADDVIVTGDSRGYLSFWDAKAGCLINQFESHSSDILSLVVSKDEKTLYCSGVDSNIVLYGRVKDKSKTWCKGTSRRIHSHDVRCLELTDDDKLYSGSVDGFLALSYFPPKTIVQYPPLPSNPFISVSRMERRILFRYKKHLELWQLPKLCLLKLECNHGTIISALLSPGGKFIIYSTEDRVSVYQFEMIKQFPDLKKLSPSIDIVSFHKAAFYTVEDRELCVLASCLSLQLQIVEFEEEKLGLLNTFDLTTTSLQDSISHICVAEDYIVVADCSSSIVLLNRDTGSVLYTLPRYEAVPTALNYNPMTRNIVIVYSDHKLVEFNISDLKFTSFSKCLPRELPRPWLKTNLPIQGVQFDETRNDIILLYDNATLYALAKNQDEGEASFKRLRIAEDNSDVRTVKHVLNRIEQVKHVAYFDWLEGNDLLVLDINHTAFQKNLPPVFKKKKYGVS